MKLEILEKSVTSGILSVTVEIKLRKFSSEQRLIVKDEHIIQLLSEEYEILSVIKSNCISNSKRGDYKQIGSWVFKLKPKKRTRSTPKKTSTKPSFRGRISNIANKIEKQKSEKEE